RRVEEVAAPSRLIGHPLRTAHVRERFGVVVLALRRAGAARVEEVPPSYEPARGDRLIVLGAPAGIDALRDARPVPAAEDAAAS
ncbi:MAG TPA: TrkA C-terminal domain-containing protein, partial [Myxococcales bacterium]|nr:TrkA C-terminal domain-containing protein [Myxococcales bacterium]